MQKTSCDSSEKEVSLFTEMRRISPKVTGGIMRAREAAYEDARVAGKYKLMTALVVSIAIRCEPCIQAYVKMALDKGIQQDEFIEFLNVAMVMQGCPGEEWAVRAYAFYKALAADPAQATSHGCCPTH